ncbi:cytochrome P450 pisatin demethylase [Pochonia chlamydosporia 170]|uniref:Cytochrome P450 pisatin demethylase n=1 Tax=Pochonia chlamydosporia 170 TaxID=1380566 RepID=A0A179FN92_METCM|nr:cytochrome P450 pisatin demethylase [Pochonia chlamydosporia 170]OAQ66758.1 cytochrome P450 pisatin demethylase [Pochonia chlamydosporia 170]
MHLFLVLGGALVAIAFTYLTSAIIAAIFSPLRSIPGPFWARFTRLWYFRRVYDGNFEHDNIDLHRRYGRVVRVAPNMYSIDAPDAVNTIYGIASKMPKSEWYEGWKHPSPDRWTLFPDRDIKRHAETRRRFQGLYSMSSLVSYENYVNECTDILQQRLSEFAKHSSIIDMTHWFQCYAFDVIGNITYSQRFGFLDRGEDVDGIIKALHGSMIYSTLIGIFPALHKYIYDIMNKVNIGGAVGRTYLMKFVGERIQQRKAERGQYAEKSVSLDENAPQDFLEKLMVQNEDNPQKVTPYHIFMMGLSNIIAGADTTAISLSAVLYYLIRSPKAMQRLRDEVEQCVTDELFNGTHLTFKQSQEMPYLQAVIKEALRLHSATGLPLWRVVTDAGLELDGRFFPPGSVIGLNTWVAHYNEDIFGADAKEFRPERWIERDDNEAEIKAMNAYYLPFGLGSRTCLGKHISFLEMSKLIPLLVRNFDFELVGEERDWKVENYWFVKPANFFVKVANRKS